MAIFGDTLFCDDMREEASGKAILIGVYGPTLLVSEDFPITIDRLSLACRLFVPGTEVPGSAEVQVFYPQSQDEPDSVGSIVLPQKVTQELSDSLPRADPLFEPRYIVGFQVHLRNFTVETEGYIRVRAICDGVIIRMGQIKIAKFAKKLPEE